MNLREIFPSQEDLIEAATEYDKKQFIDCSPSDHFTAGINWFVDFIGDRIKKFEEEKTKNE